jgi:hypothetical protein
MSEVWALQDNPIKNEMNACLAKPEGWTTSGQKQCLGEAYKAFDSEINSMANTLKNHYDGKDRVDFVRDHKQYMEERAAQFKRIDEKYQKDGSIYPVLSLSDKVEELNFKTVDYHRRLLVHENAEHK